MLSRKPGALLVALTLALFLDRMPVFAAPPQPFTLQPGGKATITFEAFCVNFGKLFPTAINGPDGTVAPDKVRAALEYAQEKGLTADSQQALQVEYAIWQLINTPNSPKGDALAQDVIAAANAATVSNPTGTSILDAAKASQVILTLDSWQPIGDKQQITTTASDHFYGRGQLTVENVSQQALTLYMPTGTVFPPASNAQNMAGIQTDITINNPKLPATGSAPGMSLTLLLIGSLLLVAGGWVLRRRVPAHSIGR